MKTLLAQIRSSLACTLGVGVTVCLLTAKASALAPEDRNDLYLTTQTMIEAAGKLIEDGRPAEAAIRLRHGWEAGRFLRVHAADYQPELVKLKGVKFSALTASCIEALRAKFAAGTQLTAEETGIKNPEQLLNRALDANCAEVKALAAMDLVAAVRAYQRSVEYVRLLRNLRDPASALLAKAIEKKSAEIIKIAPEF